MRRPVFSFRPNMDNPEHRQTWEILQSIPEGQKNQVIVSAILKSKERVCLERIVRQAVREEIPEQMLVTRISDTLTFRRDCLYNEHGQNMIRFHQVKTDIYDKPISRELAMLVQKAAEYTARRHGETKYIFVNEDDVSRPLQYTTVKYKVFAIIQREKLRDDEGKPFRFNFHMFRHYYGVKMTGLSRWFFYKNPIVRKEMGTAVQNQERLIDPCRAIIDREMENRVELLEQQVRELQRENDELKKKNAKLQKALDRKDLNFIKNL